MTNIKGKTINDAVFSCIETLINDGYRSPSRNGDISTVYNAFVEIESPKSRHLDLKGRKNNIFATIGETFWVFAGSNKIDPFLSFLLPRAHDYSDDGVTWRGGYPERIKNGNQIEDIIQQFKNEGIFTRRAVMSIYDANLDTADNLRSVYGIEKTKDRPCNLILDFFVTPDKRLHMNVKSRSGDVLWGFGSINIFEWTFFQEMILEQLQREVDPELTLGSYNHHVTNLHLYDFNGSQGYEVVDNKNKQVRGLINTDHIYFPDSDQVHSWFSEIVSLWTDMIEQKRTDFDKMMFTVNSMFEEKDVPSDDNLLYGYAQVVTAYIAAKNMNLEKNHKTNQITLDLTKYSDEFTRSIENSAFRKFRLTSDPDINHKE